MSDTKNHFYIQADVVGNSVGAKSSDTENALDDRGVIAQQFGRRGGQSLVNDLASAKHGTWSYGEIRFTDSYGLNTGGQSPKKIVHFCVSSTYDGDGTYLVCRSLLYNGEQAKFALLIFYQRMFSVFFVLLQNEKCSPF